MSNFSHRILFLCSFHLLCNFGFISFHDDTGEPAPSTDLRSQKKEHLKFVKEWSCKRFGYVLTKGIGINKRAMKANKVLAHGIPSRLYICCVKSGNDKAVMLPEHPT